MEDIIISQELFKQMCTTAGTVLGTIVTAVVGYIIWSMKQRKARQTLADTKDKILLDKVGDLDKSMKQMMEAQNRLTDGLIIALQSDIVQFRAFRKEGRLNGDSELQEKKIDDYLIKNKREDK